MSKPDDSKKSENVFEIMDGILFKLNQTKRLFVIMILTILILPPVALLITTSVFDNPFRPDSETIQLQQQTQELHSELRKMTTELEGLPQEERIQKLDEFLNSEKYKEVSTKLEELSQDDLMDLKPGELSKYQIRFAKFPQFIIFVISVVWLGIGIRQWFVLSKFSKKYERFKKQQKDIDKKLGEEKNNDTNR
jgi:hypothetical protein